MNFSVSNDSYEWSPDFGPGSVTLTEKNLVQEKTIRSQENPLAAWSLLLSQRQQFLNNHPARVPVTPNQQGAYGMMDEIHSSLGAQEGLDASGCQVSADLDDVEIHLENDHLNATLFVDRALIFLLTNSVRRLGDGRRFSRKPQSARRRGRPGGLSSCSNNASL